MLAPLVWLVAGSALADHNGSHATPCDAADSVGLGAAGNSPGPVGPPSSLGWDVGTGQCNGSFTIVDDATFPGGRLQLGLRVEQRLVGQVANNAGDYTVQTGADPTNPARAWWGFHHSIAYEADVNGLDSLTFDVRTDVGSAVLAAPVDMLAVRANPTTTFAIDDRNPKCTSDAECTLGPGVCTVGFCECVSDADCANGTCSADGLCVSGRNATDSFADLYQTAQNPVFGWLVGCSVDGDCTTGTCTNLGLGGMCLDEQGAWRLTLTAVEGGQTAQVSICVHTPGAACETCSDTIANQDETDVDCGGTLCGPCADGLACAADGDCTSGVCGGGICQAPTCSDTVTNQDESDVDCGGVVCTGCADGQLCAVDSDCTSGVCGGSLTMMPPWTTCQSGSCSDGVPNGDETDVDCGGTVCGACVNGQACGVGADCQSGVCSGGVCASCTADVDCDDGQFCNGTEICDPGTQVCGPGSPPPADDGVTCTDDVCDEATDTTVSTPNDAICDDGQFCNGVETCDAITDCQSGTTVDCSGSGVGCGVGFCDEVADACGSQPDDSNCDDGLFCNGAETCTVSGTCSPGTPPDCTLLSDDCAVGSCSEAAGGCAITAVNEGGACDDGDPCTPDDVCVLGSCVAGGVTCGNGVVDAVCGEQCDPPSLEVCNNLVDDDLDGLADCEDTDCQGSGASSCDATCQLVGECKFITRDPGKIIFGIGPFQKDKLKLKGSIPMDPALLFPNEEGFGVLLTNSNGEVYRAEVPAADLEVQRSGKYRFRDRSAKDTPGVHDGLALVKIRVRRSQGQFWYQFRVLAYGDLSAATEAEMVVQISGVLDVASRNDIWTQIRRGWKLRNF